MADQQHPITPSPELRQLWAQQAQRMDPHDPVAWQQHVATQAARWGSDQELEACCEWLEERIGGIYHRELRADRRPKPPSLKAQALSLVPESGGIAMKRTYSPDELALIRRALESLPS